MSRLRVSTAATRRIEESGVPPPPTVNGDRKESPPSHLGAVLQSVIDSLNGTLHSLAADVAAVRARLDELEQHNEQRGRSETIIAELHKRCTELSEEFHQRETLGPVFHCLIAIADRCRDKMQYLRDVAEVQSKDPSLFGDLHDLIQARKADCVEVEHTLALLGVQRFKSRQRMFDSSVQKPVRAVPTANARQDEHIAKRIHPGYKRDGRIIRPELVSVYSRSSFTSKGEKACTPSL